MKNLSSPENPMIIAVHLHLFYADMWQLMKSYLRNLRGLHCDLFVTMVEENAKITSDIRALFPDCKIFLVENRGYDVGPFIYFLHQIDLKKYDLILKIHTKNINDNSLILINGRFINRKNWFYLLINALIGSKKIVIQNIQKFHQNPKLGMIGSKYLITSDNKLSFGMEKNIFDIMNNVGCPCCQEILFVPGTMFWVRAQLLERLKNNFSIDDFSVTNGQLKNGTLAHILERVLGCIVVSEGYEIEGYDKYPLLKMSNIGSKLRRFLFQHKITKSSYELVKICKIPVYHCKAEKKSKAP